MSFPLYRAPLARISVADMRTHNIHHAEQGLLDATIEHAGRGLARVVADDLRRTGGSDVLLCVGQGHNGAVTLVAGRLLASWGYPVSGILSHDPRKLKMLGKKKFDVTHDAGVSFTYWHDHHPPAVPSHIIDGLIGYNIAGILDGILADMVSWINHQPARVIATDIPSGLHPNDGTPMRVSVRANKTVALGLPVAGMLSTQARTYTGRLFVADTGIPMHTASAMPSDLFQVSDIIEITQ